jgi:hypothetical protein
VLRCGVAVFSADGVLYVGALKFDTPCDLPWPERFERDNAIGLAVQLRRRYDIL